MRKTLSIQMRWTLLFTAIASLSGASVAQAQGHCFRGQPLPACKFFWIGEVGYGYLPDRGPGNPSHQLTLDLGAMANLNERSAVGGTAYLGSEVWFESLRFGLKARYRYWLSDYVSLEASPGILLYDLDASTAMTGFTGHVAVNLLDLLAVTGSLDAFDGRELWTVGARGGSYVALGAVGLAVAGVIAIMAISCAAAGASCSPQ